MNPMRTAVDVTKSWGKEDIPRSAAWGLLALMTATTVLARLSADDAMGLPYIWGDELWHKQYARRALEWGGMFWAQIQTHHPSWLYPLFLAPLTQLHPPAREHAAMIVANTLAFHATLPLTYGLARQYCSRKRALLAAAVTALLPTMVMGSVLMAECLYVPAAVGAFWLALRAMERPTVGRRLAAGAAFGLLYHIKPQGLVVPILFALAVALARLDVFRGSESVKSKALRYAKSLTVHWLTAAAWAAAAGLRFLEAALAEKMPDPWTLNAFFGGYAGRAQGDANFQWGYFLLILACNLAVVSLATGLFPFASLLERTWRCFAPSRRSYPRLDAEEVGRHRDLICLTAVAVVALAVLGARFTVVNVDFHPVSERYLFPAFPLLAILFVHFAQGKPVLPGKTVLFSILAVLSAALGVYVARLDMWLTHASVPTLTWYFLFAYKDMFPSLFYGFAALMILPWLFPIFTFLNRRAAGNKWSVCAQALFVLTFLFGLNWAWYAVHANVIFSIARQQRETARLIVETVGPDDRQITIVDRLNTELMRQIQFAIPGQPVRLSPSAGDWKTRPLLFKESGEVILPDQERYDWLLAHPSWRFSRPPWRRFSSVNLYKLDESRPLVADWEQILDYRENPTEPPPVTFPELEWIEVSASEPWEAGKTNTMRLTLRHSSRFAWTAGDLQFAVGYQWINPNLIGDVFGWYEGGHLPRMLTPEQTFTLDFTVEVPDQAATGWQLMLYVVAMDEDNSIETMQGESKMLMPDVDNSC